MKTILIPIGFSDTSANALQYVADFSKDVEVDRIILLRSVYVSVYAQVLPSLDFVQLSADDIGEERSQTEERLKDISRKLVTKCDPCLKIETITSGEPLLSSIREVIENEKPNMLIIGSENDEGLDGSYVSGQVITIAKTSPIPVMIIPANVRYKKIEKAVVPCDFAAISRLDMLKKIPGAKKWLHPQLMVLNISNQQKQHNPNEERANALKELLEDYEYKVYHAETRNTIEGILNFAKKHDAQLIIALPGKYSFFYSFTHKNITEALALNAYHPVLILK
jgi:nucleotide-binding universal stress UspA family protein